MLPVLVAGKHISTLVFGSATDSVGRGKSSPFLGMLVRHFYQCFCLKPSPSFYTGLWSMFLQLGPSQLKLNMR